MRRCFYSSFSLVQCARRMQTLIQSDSATVRTESDAATVRTESDSATFRTEHRHRRKAINLSKLIEQDLLINKKLGNNESIEDSQWGKVRKELLQCESVNDINVDSQVYDICAHFDRVDQSINYYQFLERNKYSINLATMTMYLKLLASLKIQSQTPLTKEEEKGIMKIYKKIKKEYEILDPKSAYCCIAGLSLTKNWEECFKLLEMIKFIQNPGTKELSLIIAAALRNDKIDIAWKMLNETLVTQPVQQWVYTEYLNYCKRNFAQDKLIQEVEKMFLIWQKYNVLPQKHIIQEYQELFESLGYTGKPAAISKKGICLNCRAQLKPTLITKEDFKVLSSAILKNLIVGKDVFYNTSPQELKKYMMFLQTLKPYDVIIDGLNVAYATRGPDGRSKGSIENILHVVNYFQKRNKRTLVVGRVHMKWWSTKAQKTLEDITDTFYMKNLSQDDPFLLHLTLTSGSETCFVSRDFMRQHKYKIEDPTLQQLFKNWQMSHQYFFKTIPQGRGFAIKVIEPLQFHPSAQKNDDGWHIPYTTYVQMLLPQVYESPEDWLCMKSGKREKC